MMCKRWVAGVVLGVVCVAAQAQGPLDFTSFYTPEQALEMARRANGGSLTPEQEQRILARYGQTPPPVTQTQAVSISGETEDGLAARIAALPPVKSGLQVEGRKDGFSVNGQVFVDAEGNISKYAFDTLSGEVTYLVETSPNNFVVKFTRLGSTQDGIAIATAQIVGSAWQVQTATGKKLRGEQLVVLAKGVMLARGSAVFKYAPGIGLQNFAVPDGWMVANYQRGNVGSTDLLLLEKLPVSQNSTGGLFSTFKSLGNTLSLNEDKNFALLQVKEGKITEFAIDSAGKTVPDPNGCRKTSAFTNDCSNARQIESLYDKTGDRNINHYFWRLNWFNTPQGPVAVALENLMKDVSVTDINSGKKATVLNRTMGISRMDTSIEADGKVKVIAKVGFETQTVDDAVAAMNKALEAPKPEVDKK
jgi:hypothetical protein